MTRFVGALTTCLCGLASLAVGQGGAELRGDGGREAQQQGRRLRNVMIQTHDVFLPSEAESNLFFGIANLLHVPTREEVIRREVFLRRGDFIDQELVDELERNLRGTGLFGAVSATLIDTGPDDAGDSEFDLDIRTRDRFSLTAGATQSFFGGVSKFSAAISEDNLFGTGKRVGVQYRNAEDERRAILRYRDPQLLGSWHHLDLIAGETEEGPAFSAGITRPFKHLADPLSYGIQGSHRDREVDYYRSGNTVAEIPETRTEARVFLTGAGGPRHRRTFAGVDARMRHSVFDAATGSDAARIRVPPDTFELQVGPTLGLDYALAYREVLGLDALDFTEDLWLGFAADLRLAGVHYDRRGENPQTQALVALNLRSAVEVRSDTLMTAEVAGSVRFDEELQGWQNSVALHVFNLSLPQQTLAGSLTFDIGADYQDLVPEFTIGEDNGLRGYPAREFAGSRITRLNLENRIRTDLEVLSVHVGFAVFFDTAWIHGTRQGLSMRDSVSSAGVGMRLGSSHLAGSGVLRVDLAWPLDRVNGEEFGVSLSVSPGQVFTYFGNQSQLSGEFDR